MPEEKRLAADAALSFPVSFGIAERSCYYLCAPMTTGGEFRQLRALEKFDDPNAKQLRAEAFQRNVERIAPIAASLRSSLAGPLIDPTPFSVDGWTQSAYHAFWLAVIRKWCHTVILSDGWQYSTGCCKEVGLAIADCLTLLDESLRPISADAARALVTSIVQDEDAPLSDEYLRAAQALLATSQE